MFCPEIYSIFIHLLNMLSFSINIEDVGGVLFFFSARRQRKNRSRHNTERKKGHFASIFPRFEECSALVENWLSVFEAIIAATTDEQRN